MVIKVGDRVDWDWEDRPSRDTPSRRAPDEPEEGRDEDGSPFQELPPLDAAPDYVLPGRPGGPAGGEAPGPDRDRPPMETVDAAEQPVVGAERRDRDQYRPRSAEDRAAARAHRRSQLRRRRLIALAVVVALVVLLVFLIVRGCGGSDAAAAAAAFAVPFVDRRLLVATERP